MKIERDDKGYLTQITGQYVRFYWHDDNKGWNIMTAGFNATFLAKMQRKEHVLHFFAELSDEQKQEIEQIRLVIMNDRKPIWT